MKKLIWILFLVVVMGGCAKENGAGSTSITFRKADLSGTSLLALASGGAETRAAGDYSTKSILWKVNPDGSMIEVTYTIEIEGTDGSVAATIQQNGRLTMENLFPIGDKWLWLVNASIACPDVDLNQMGVDTGPYNYLLRRSDGALFRWFDENGQEGNTIRVAGNAQDAQDKDIAPYIGTIGGDVYSVLGDILVGVNDQHSFNRGIHRLEQGIKPSGGVIREDGVERVSLVRLTDKAQTIEMVSLLPSNIVAYDCLTTTRGQIASTVRYENGNSWAHILVDPSSRSIKLIQVPESVNVADQTSLIMLGGEPYLMIKKDQDSYFGKVDSDGGVDRVASFTGEDELSFPNSLVYRETKASWVTNGKRYVFDPQAKLFTDKQLPAHYPGQESSYCDGVAYVVEQQGALPSSFFKCDLIADAAEERNVSWSAEAQNYGLQTVPGGASYRFMSASKTLVRTASLVDGRSISFYIDVEKNSGSCMVSGSQQSGQLVSTLVRLN